MKLITREIERDENLAWARAHGSDRVRAAVARLPTGVTPEQVEQVWRETVWRGGHGNLYTTSCDECGSTKYPFIRVGQEPDHDSATATLCRVCTRKAMALVGDGMAP